MLLLPGIGGLSRGGVGEEEISPELLLPYSSPILIVLTLNLLWEVVGLSERVRDSMDTACHSVDLLHQVSGWGSPLDCELVAGRRPIRFYRCDYPEESGGVRSHQHAASLFVRFDLQN